MDRRYRNGFRVDNGGCGGGTKLRYRGAETRLFAGSTTTSAPSARARASIRSGDRDDPEDFSGEMSKASVPSRAPAAMAMVLRKGPGTRKAVRIKPTPHNRAVLRAPFQMRAWRRSASIFGMSNTMENRVQSAPRRILRANPIRFSASCVMSIRRSSRSRLAARRAISHFARWRRGGRPMTGQHSA